MEKVFLYPKFNRYFGTPNPYIFNFHDALEKKFRVVNKNSTPRGILNLFLHFHQTDVFIFNWIETLPEKKYGKVQVSLFKLFLRLCRVNKKKIIWVLHNKGSHHGKDSKRFNTLFNRMFQVADVIITHSNSGLSFCKENYPNYSYKVKVINHPINSPLISSEFYEKKFDLAIWGTIFPYKGIDKFLEFTKDKPEYENVKILIVGKCPDLNYRKKLESIAASNVELDFNLYTLEELANICQLSKFTLFTYRSETVISSGSLIDSIRMRSKIIGPDHGAFKDLKHYSFIKTYNSFEEITEIIHSFKPDNDKFSQDIDNFAKENTWEKFIEKLGIILNQLN